MRKYFWLLITGFWLLAPSKALYACPMCSDIVSRGKDALKVMNFGEGIAWSIALFFMVPLVLIGGMVLMIYRASKKQKEATHHEGGA